MTAPQPIVPGRIHLLTRRCTQRQFLLRPDDDVEHIYEYCLAEAAARFDVTVYGWVAMSDHQHLLVRDNRGNIPEFEAHLNKMVAKALNAKWKRRENLWSNEPPSRVYVVEPADMFRKLIYLLANPVADHLVERVAHWPGACSLGVHLSGKAKKIKRPKGFFREDGPMPETVELRAEKLPGYESTGDAAWADMIQTAVAEVEERARQARARTGLRVLGRKAVRRALPSDTARSPAKRGGLRPLVACRRRSRRRKELHAIRAFRVAYRIALDRWRRGDFSVVFPAGTFRMARLGAICEAPS